MAKRRKSRKKRASGMPRVKRSFGFRGRKKPKRPKMSAGINSWRNYDAKVTKWESEMSEKQRLLNKHGHSC